MRTLPALLLLTLLAAPLAAGAQDKAAAPPPPKIDTLKRIRDTGVLTLGVRETSVPFSYLDAQKEPQGYSVDLCMRVADAIKGELKLSKLDVKFVPVSSSNRIPALVEGRIDLECGSTTNTRERPEPLGHLGDTRRGEGETVDEPLVGARLPGRRDVRRRREAGRHEQGDLAGSEGGRG